MGSVANGSVTTGRVNSSQPVLNGSARLVRAVVVAQFARIHVANLVNFGIVPLTFARVEDYDKINQGDQVSLDVSNLEGELFLEVNGEKIPLNPAFEPGDVPVLKAGGALAYFKATYEE